MEIILIRTRMLRSNTPTHEVNFSK